MNVVLFVYASKAFQEFLLPAINNADTQITLKKEIFSFPKDLCVQLEVIENVWYIRNSSEYKWEKQQGEEGRYLQDGDIINIKTKDGKGISLIVQSGEKTFSVYRKYNIAKMENVTIGNRTENTIQYQYHALVSKRHAVISRTENGLLLQDISTNGTFVNDKRVEGEQYLHVGDCINIFGLKIVIINDLIAIGSSEKAQYIVSEKIDEYIPSRKKADKSAVSIPVSQKYFHRAPRGYVAPVQDEIEIEAPPVRREERKRPLWMVIGPSLTMILPMVAGSIMSILASKSNGQNANIYMYTGMITTIGSALMGVYWALMNMKYNKEEIQKSEQKRFQAYGDYLIEKAETLRGQYKEEKERLLVLYPAADEVVSYTRNSSKLWNRNWKQGDFLCERLGIGTLPFPIRINIPKERFQLFHDELAKKPEFIAKEYQMMSGVPINVDLCAYKLIGVVGGSDKKGAFEIIRLLSAQIAANNCYTDVKLAYIYDENKDLGEWDYAKWLPHVWSEDKKTRYLAGNKEQASDVLFELTEILRLRTEEEERREDFPKPYYILVVSEIGFLESELITKYIYECDPSLGLTTLILAENREQLPNQCEYLIEKDGNYAHLYDMDGGKEQKVDFDTVSHKAMEEFARKLAAIEVRENAKGSNLVNSLSFMEMWKVHTLEELHVEERWRKNRTYENMRALIGEKAGGVPCYLDVHEKYHGPHGLVAGTTGSGKSETLQTYMLSLAINFSPDDVAYFIIDYKGGGMAGLFEGMPHLIGSISNLSGNQVRRAMVSIKSENRRRQRIFNEHNVNNINLYTKLYKNGEAKKPIPHMFIVIDEFAELKREETEFMKELISVAQVGRSLGVHLILATQKPSGTVDENIRSNSKFRLCLRVQDKQDSNDMLHKPDAAYITQAGRCYLQVGNDEVYDLFQSGYSGAIYDTSNRPKAESVSLVGRTGKVEVVRAAARSETEEKRPTQLEAVIRYLGKVARQEGYVEQMQLWQPPLLEKLYLEQVYSKEDFPGWENNQETSGQWELSVPIGRCDDPENQEQPTLFIDFSGKGHLALCGTIVSGKSTFLQTLLYALIQKYSPAWLNIYAIDYSSNALGAFEDAPQVGGVLYEDDTDKLEKLFFLLANIMEERRKLLRGGNYAQYVHANGVVFPAILLVIDNLGAFREKTESRYDSEILRILKAGIGCGIYLVVSAAGFGTNEITVKMADNIKNVLCLQMNDKFAYTDVLRNNRIEILPENNVKGRGLAVVGERVLEFQTALALEAEDDFMRLELLKKESQNMAHAWNGKKVRKIPFIPENPKWKEFSHDEEVQRMNQTREFLAVGWDMKSAKIYGIPLSHTYSYIVSGKERTGKTNFLKAVAKSAVSKGGKIIILDRNGNKYAQIAEEEGIEYVTTVQEREKFFSSMVEPFRERNQKKKKLLEKGMEEDEIFNVMKQEMPYFILIDDLVDFLRSIMEEEEKSGVTIRRFVENIAEKGKLHHIYFFAGLNPDQVGDLVGNRMFRGFTGHHTGICFGGNVTTPMYFEFANLSRENKGQPQKAGIGLLPADNEEVVEKILVPLVKE